MNDVRLCLTYILPIRTSSAHLQEEFCDYVHAIAAMVETIVVDGSEASIFAEHARAWGKNVIHIQPDEDLASPMGKVGGVLTGLRRASFRKIIVADDDVRYDAVGLREVAEALDDADVVRPQNYFAPLTWHAMWDTGRILLNRISGGDWPGTLGVSRELLLRAGGYDGTVMFENLELVRTIVAAGGREVQLPATFVGRRPSSTRHFWSQRIRQAYDEFARPARLVFQLAWIPATIAGIVISDWYFLAAMIGLTLALAEAGRRIRGGRRVFPPVTVLFAPLWILERSVCVWLAVTARIIYGGMPYRGTVLRKAATHPRVLRQRLASAAARYQSA